MKPVFESFGEPKINRRKFVLGALFASAAGFAAWRLPRRMMDRLGKQKLDDLVPKKVGQWEFVASSGVVVPLNDPLLNLLYSQQLTRVYSDGVNPPLMLLMAQSGSQTGFLQVHRPDFCYRAAGYMISKIRPHPIQLGNDIIPASWMDATNGQGMERVIFWTRIGDRIPRSWIEQKLTVAEQNLHGIVPDAILIRLSMVSDDPVVAQAAIDGFVRSMLDLIPADRRSVFIL